jgi:Queuine tRNA-ribosyltransferase
VSLLPDIFVTKDVSIKGNETLPGKILVVTSCTKDKKTPDGISPHQQLGPDELWDEDTDNRVKRNFDGLEQCRVAAGELYQGRQHLQLMQGVNALRQAFGDAVVDVKIISAGFGLVDEEEKLPPYNATFADQSSAKVMAIAQRLGIPQAMDQLMQGQYDCAFFLLGENYLLSIGLPFAHTPSFPCLFLSGPSSHKRIPRSMPYRFVRVGQDDSIEFSYNLIGLKGQLFKLFADQIINPDPRTPSTLLNRDASKAERLKNFFTNPTPHYFHDIVRPFRHIGRVSTAQQTKSMAVQASLFTPIKKFDGPNARNYKRLPMRYFIPDWEDLVDPGYNFETDTATPERRKYHDEVYAHEIYECPNYDGMLFSKNAVESGRTKPDLIREMGGIHSYARFENKPILGDCGAFSYITAKDPPYETKEILDYYQSYGFDYGVSIDHLIIPAFYDQKEYRYHLTQENAREFIKLHREGGYDFTPVGVAQGWSPETYMRAVEKLLEDGYKYIALGGLARTPTEAIMEIVQAITPTLQEDTNLHLFGVARDRNGDEMERFRKLGATSFDSASYLRRAWLSGSHNYFTEEGERYAALRISPVYGRSSRVKKLIADGLATFEKLQQLEKDALKAVRAYDKGQLGLEETLDVLLEIDRIGVYDYEKHLPLYRRVLEDQPWKKCGCEVCRELGVEVVIFRGNDRNRRRGFHNTYVFYKRFRELIQIL